MSFASLADMVKHYESGGNYTAQNPTTSASGAYQFTNPTWQTYAGQIGYSQYTTAASAPPAVQDAVFQQAVSQRGLSDWTCPGCNANLTSYLSANPDQASLPVTSTGNATLANAGDTSGQGYGSNGTGSQTWNDPYAADPGAYTYGGGSPASTTTPGGSSTLNVGDAALAGQPGTAVYAPFQFGLTTGLGKAVNDWISNIMTAVGTAFKNAAVGVLGTVANLYIRGEVIIIALVLLAIALWRIIDPSGEKTKAVIHGAAVAA